MSWPNWIFKRSDGKTLTFGNDSIAILYMKGIDELKVEVFKKKRAVGDGDIITGYRIPSRELEIGGEVVDPRMNKNMREIMNSFFSQRYTYDVYITYLGEQRYAKSCRLLRYKCPPKNINIPAQPVVNMLCEDGYFLSIDEFGENLASTFGGSGFPYVNLVGKSRPFAYFLFGADVEINNDGDADAHCKAVITFRGSVVNPYIKKDGSFVKCLDSFSIGDTLVINSYDKSITKNGVNISAKVDKGSRWNDLVFKIGANTIGYDADAGNNLMDVTIYFNKRHLGV